MAAGLRLLRAYCSKWHAGDLAGLRADYARLFVGPDKLQAPPWESVFRSSEHLLFEKYTVQVREMYRRFGLQAPRLNAEPDDHIGLELAFMVHLCSLAIKAIGSGQSARFEECALAMQEFLNDHLMKWAPEFAQRVIEAAETDYYRGVAYLLVGTLAETATVFERAGEAKA